MNNLPPIFQSSIFNTSAFYTEKSYLTKEQADKLYLSISTSFDLTYLTGTIPGYGQASKALVLDTNRDITNINSLSASSLILSSNTLTGTEISYLTSITPGIATASKALVFDSNREITNIRKLSLTCNAANGIVITHSATTSNASIQLVSDTVSSQIGCNGSATSNPNTFFISHNGSSRLVVSSSGDVSIGTSTAGYKLNVNGSLNCTSFNINGSLLTSTIIQLNYNNISTTGTAEASKTLVLDSSRNITNINSLTATNLTGTLQTAAQPNITSLGTLTSLSSSGSLTASSLILGGNTLTGTEISYLTSITPGTASANKALVLDSSSNISGINNITSNKFLTNLSTSNTLNDSSFIDQYQMIFKENQNTNGDSLGMVFTISTNANSISTGGGYIKFTRENSHSVGYLSFGTKTTTVQTADIIERMRIKSNGNVNIITGLELAGNLITATASELNYNDITTIGVAEASKALILDSNREITNIRKLSLTCNAANGIVITHGATTSNASIQLVSDTVSSQIGCNGSATSNPNSFFISHNGGSRLVISSSGDVSIGTSTAGYKLNVNGNLNCTNLYLNASLVTSTAAELNYNDITTLGTFQSSKTMTLDSNGVGWFNGLGSSTTNNLKFYGNTANKEIINIFRASDDGGLVIGTKAQTIQKCGPLLNLYSGYDQTDVVGTSSAETIELFKINNKLVGFADNYVFNIINGYLLGTPPWKSSGFANYHQMSSSMEAMNISVNTSTFTTYKSSNNILLYNDKVYFNTIDRTLNTGCNFLFNGSGCFIGNSNWMNGSNEIITEWKTSTTNRVHLQINPSNEAFFGTVDNYPLSFTTNNSRRLTITTSGRLGINTTSPSTYLHVNGGVTVAFALSAIYSELTPSTTNYSLVGPVSRTLSARFSDAILCSSACYVESDRRIKENIIDIEIDNAYKFLKDARPVSYNLKKNKEKKEIGFIAQDLAKHLELLNFIQCDDLPIEDKKRDIKDVLLSVDYSKICVILTKILQDMNERLKKIEKVLSEFDIQED